MKCLSVQQPWAFGIIHRDKTIENRTWYTNYRGPLLIHTGKSKGRIGNEAGLFDAPYEGLAFGAIIGQVELVDCVCLLDFPAIISSKYAEGPYCWLLRNPVAFDSPIPYKGQRGLFDVNIDALLQTPAAAPLAPP